MISGSRVGLSQPKFTVSGHLDASSQETALPGWEQHYTQVSSGRFQGSLTHLDLGRVTLGEEKMNVATAQTTAPPKGKIVLVVPPGRESGRINGEQRNDELFIHVGGSEIDLHGEGQSSSYYVTVNEADIAAFDRQKIGPISGVSNYPGSADLSSWLGALLATAPDNLRLSPGDMEQVLPALLIDRVNEVCAFLVAQITPTNLRGSYAYALFKRAKALAEDQLESNLSVTDLASALSVPDHVLRAAFAQTTGESPRSWLRQRRLDRARRMLLTPDVAQKSVAQIAMACGFFHLGRFAAQYAQTFQESPVETMRLVTSAEKRWT